MADRLECRYLAAKPGEAVEVEAPPIAPVDLDTGRPPIDVDADHGAERGERAA